MALLLDGQQRGLPHLGSSLQAASGVASGSKATVERPWREPGGLCVQREHMCALSYLAGPEGMVDNQFSDSWVPGPVRRDTRLTGVSIAGVPIVLGLKQLGRFYANGK